MEGTFRYAEIHQPFTTGNRYQIDGESNRYKIPEKTESIVEARPCT